MRTPILVGLFLGCSLAMACAKQEDTPPPAAAQPYPAQQYPAQQYPAQQYPAQQSPAPAPATGTAAPAPAATTAAPAATAPAPAGGTQMATPGPLALPCQNDQGCGLARCNMQYQKCAFPCQSAVDCAPNATCNTATGFCLPSGQQ